MLIGITKVELSPDESHQSRLGDLYAKITIAVSIMAVKCAQITSTCGISCCKYLRYVVEFERGSKGELSHRASMFKFDIWNAFVRHHV